MFECQNGEYDSKQLLPGIFAIFGIKEFPKAGEEAHHYRMEENGIEKVEEVHAHFSLFWNAEEERVGLTIPGGHLATYSMFKTFTYRV